MMLHNSDFETKQFFKRILLKSIWRYSPIDLERALRRVGIDAGDVLMIHASWLQDNGFSGSTKEFLDTFKKVLTPAGLLIMTSMPYIGESSREFLLRGGTVKLKNSASKMGLLSEVMRRGRSTSRSLSPTHPLLVWGDRAEELILGHSDTEYSFGEDSPFGKLAQLDAKVLLVDAPFKNITYNHYLEHCVRNHLPGTLYDDKLYMGRIIDFSGQVHDVPVRVLSANSSALRIDDKLEDYMLKRHLIKKFRVGNTRFQLLSCRQMKSCIDDMAAQRLL
jgi:aminoglycoside 3-N-acetyltransferase